MKIKILEDGNALVAITEDLKSTKLEEERFLRDQPWLRVDGYITTDIKLVNIDNLSVDECREFIKNIVHNNPTIYY